MSIAATTPSSRVHTPCYCEENVFQLIQEFARSAVGECSLDGIYVVFISNETAQIPIWRQRASQAAGGGLVIWDYHVVAIALPYSSIFSSYAIKSSNLPPPPTNASLVYDLDTTLPLPCPIDIYASHVFRPFSHSFFPPRLFRVIPAAAFLHNFASDRSHMLLSGSSQKYSATLPPYACITNAAGETHTLPRYLKFPAQAEAASDWAATSLADGSGGGGSSAQLASSYGVVLTEAAFLSFCQQNNAVATNE